MSDPQLPSVQPNSGETNENQLDEYFELGVQIDAEEENASNLEELVGKPSDADNAGDNGVENDEVRDDGSDTGDSGGSSSSGDGVDAVADASDVDDGAGFADGIEGANGVDEAASEDTAVDESESIDEGEAVNEDGAQSAGETVDSGSVTVTSVDSVDNSDDSDESSEDNQGSQVEEASSDSVIGEPSAGGEVAATEVGEPEAVGEGSADATEKTEKSSESGDLGEPGITPTSSSETEANSEITDDSAANESGEIDELLVTPVTFAEVGVGENLVETPAAAVSSESTPIEATGADTGAKIDSKLDAEVEANTAATSSHLDTEPESSAPADEILSDDAPYEAVLPEVVLPDADVDVPANLDASPSAETLPESTKTPLSGTSVNSVVEASARAQDSIASEPDASIENAAVEADERQITAVEPDGIQLAAAQPNASQISVVQSTTATEPADATPVEPKVATTDTPAVAAGGTEAEETSQSSSQTPEVEVAEPTEPKVKSETESSLQESAAPSQTPAKPEAKPEKTETLEQPELPQTGLPQTLDQLEEPKAQQKPEVPKPEPAQMKLPQTTEEEIEALLRLLQAKYAVSGETPTVADQMEKTAADKGRQATPAPKTVPGQKTPTSDKDAASGVIDSPAETTRAKSRRFATNQAARTRLGNRPLAPGDPTGAATDAASAAKAAGDALGSGGVAGATRATEATGEAGTTESRAASTTGAAGAVGAAAAFAAGSVIGSAATSAEKAAENAVGAGAGSIAEAANRARRARTPRISGTGRTRRPTAQPATPATPVTPESSSNANDSDRDKTIPIDRLEPTNRTGTVPPRPTEMGSARNLGGNRIPAGRGKQSASPSARPRTPDDAQFGAELFGDGLLGESPAGPTTRPRAGVPRSATQNRDTTRGDSVRSDRVSPSDLTDLPESPESLSNEFPPSSIFPEDMQPGDPRLAASGQRRTPRGTARPAPRQRASLRNPVLGSIPDASSPMSTNQPATPRIQSAASSYTPLASSSPQQANTTQADTLRLDERTMLAGATVLPEIGSHVKKHWLSSVLTLLLTPLCWWMLADAMVRIQDASIASVAGHSTYSAFGLIELLGGVAIIAILLFLAAISGAGLIVTGGVLTLVGLAFLALPNSMATLLTPLINAISDSSVGQVVVQNLSNTAFNGLIFITGVIMLGGGITISYSRRQGRTEEADRVEVAATNPDGLHARWAKKATEAAKQRELRQQHPVSADDFFERPQEGKADKRRQQTSQMSEKNTQQRNARQQPRPQQTVKRPQGAGNPQNAPVANERQADSPKANKQAGSPQSNKQRVLNNQQSQQTQQIQQSQQPQQTTTQKQEQGQKPKEKKQSTPQNSQKRNRNRQK